jgi:hypothetical protein
MQGQWWTFIQTDGYFGRRFITFLSFMKWFTVPIFIAADLILAYLILIIIALDGSTDELQTYLERLAALIILEVFYMMLIFVM